MAWVDTNTTTAGGWTGGIRRASPLARTAPRAPTLGTPEADAGAPSIGSPIGGNPPPVRDPMGGTGLPQTQPVTPPTVRPPVEPWSDEGITRPTPTADTGVPNPAPVPGLPPSSGTGTPPTRPPTFRLDDYLVDFGPGNDLQGTQINPQASPRLQAVRDSALSRVQNQPRFTAVTAADGERTQRMAGLTDAAASELATAPDRAALAEAAFRRLVESSAPSFQQELRQVGDAAAAYGRIGSGLTTNDLGTVAQRRESSLARARAELADQAAGLTLSDRVTRTNALAGLEGAARGAEQSVRGEARGERSAEQDAFRQALGNDLTVGDVFARDEQGARDELRGERSFQTSQERDAFERALRQAGFNADQRYRQAQLELEGAGLAQGQANQASGAVSRLLEQAAIALRSGDRAGVNAAVERLRAAGLTDQQIVDQLSPAAGTA